MKQLGVDSDGLCYSIIISKFEFVITNIYVDSACLLILHCDIIK